MSRISAKVILVGRSVIAHSISESRCIAGLAGF